MLESRGYNLKTAGPSKRLLLEAKEFELHQLSAVARTIAFFSLYLYVPNKSRSKTGATYYIHYLTKMLAKDELVEEVYKPMIFKFREKMQLFAECTSASGEIDLIINTKIIK